MTENDRFPSAEQIRSAKNGSLASLIEMDAAGFLMRPGEAASDFADRIVAMRARTEAFYDNFKQNGSFEFYPGIVLDSSRQIPDPILDEAAAVTEAYYGFTIKWVPGYFISQGLGVLWGGCAVSEDIPDAVPVFIIRKNFRFSRKWFIYSRTELLSHELCHAARAPIHDPVLEEHFAYAVSSSAFRRTVGNCFQRDIDAVLFLLPVFLLLGVQIAVYYFNMTWLPVWLFWILAFIWPVVLLNRNRRQRSLYFKAEKNLKKIGFLNPAAALFRCSCDEIRKISEMSPDQTSAYVKTQMQKESRWRVIMARFGTEVPVN